MTESFEKNLRGLAFLRSGNAIYGEDIHNSPLCLSIILLFL